MPKASARRNRCGAVTLSRCATWYYREYELSLTSLESGQAIPVDLWRDFNGDRVRVPGRAGSTFSLRCAHHPGSYRLRFAVDALATVTG